MITNEFKKLEVTAKRLGATTSKSAEDVADTLMELKKHGKKKNL
ncbi:hypothetical protein [Lysinibacillus sp. NPDC093692]